MIDFRKKDLYKRENARMQRFLKHKLVTNTEQEQRELEEIEGSGDLNTLEAGDFYEGASFEIGDDSSLGGFDESSFGGFGDAGERSGVKNAQDWQQDSIWKTFLMAPLFLLKYVFVDLTEDFPSRHEWKDILKALNTINIISIITTILAFAIGVKTIFTPGFQFLAGLIMFIFTTVVVQFIYKEETKTIQIVKHLLGITGKDKTEEYSFDESTKDLMNQEQEESLESNEDSSFGGLMDFSDPFGENPVTNENYMNLDNGANLADEEYEVVEREDDNSEGGLPESPIEIKDNDVYIQGLLDVYARGDVNTGKSIPERGKLVESFSGYLIQNDRSFGSWVRPKERSTEYNNIAYSIFKGLSIIETRFGSYEEDQTQTDTMVILDIRKSPLLYRIELELPEYIKESKIQRSIKVMEDVLREAEDDLKVSVLVSTFRGSIVIKLLRLDNTQLVSLGDILRFNDEEKGYVGLDAFRDTKKGLPILFGLQNNENPYVIDWEENTSGTIVGTSGSGKSWATFEMMLNFVIANDYNNLNFIILDNKNSSFWNTFARMPHVLGYHTDPTEYIDILMEVEEERQRRQVFLNELGVENLKGYRQSLREAGEYEKLKEVPMLFLVMEEITSTMARLKEMDEELFKTASSLLGQISAQGRSSGVRILSIGQRTTYDSIPKLLMANSSFKFGMMMEVSNDFTLMFDDDVKKLKYPNTTGMGLSRSKEVMDIQMVKTLTIGGKDETQMVMLIRSIAFDWIRRSHGLDNIVRLPQGMKFEKSYNRDELYKISKKEMSEGRILNAGKENPGYEFDFSNEGNKEAGYRIKQIQKRQQNNEEIEQENIEDEPKIEEEIVEQETQNLTDENEKEENSPNLDTITDESFEQATEENQLFQKEKPQTLTVDDDEDEVELDFDFGFDEIEIEEEDEDGEEEIEIPIYPDAEEQIESREVDNGKPQNIENYRREEYKPNNQVDREETTEIEINQNVEEPNKVKGDLIDTTSNVDIGESKIEGLFESTGGVTVLPEDEKGVKEPISLEERMEQAQKESENGSEELSEVLRKPVRSSREETTTYGSEDGENKAKRALNGLITPETTSSVPTSLEDHLKVHSHVHSQKEGKKSSNAVSIFDLLNDEEPEEELEETTQQNVEEQIINLENQKIEQQRQEQEEAARLKQIQLEHEKQQEETIRAQKEAERQEQLLKEEEAKKQEMLIEQEKLRKEREEVERERQLLKEQKAKTRINEQNEPETVEEGQIETISKNLNTVNRTEQIQAQPMTQQTKSSRGQSDNAGINLGFSSTNAERKTEPNLSIKEYIAKYGQAKGFNIYLSKSEIEEVYSQRRITEALDRMVMVEADDFYVIRM